MYILVNRSLPQSIALVLGSMTLLLLVLAVACGGAAAPGEEPASAPEVGGAQTPSVQPTNSPAPVVEPAAATEPVSGEISRSLVIVSNLEPNHLDWMDGNAGAGTEHFRNSFTEPLTQRITGSSELKGLAAESWEAVDGDPKHWRFKLRQGITFHNGEKFDANAAATDLNFIKLPERGMIYSEAVGGPHEVQAVDDYTLDIICEDPCPLAPTGARFSLFAAPDWYTNAPEDERRSIFISSGPYKFVSWDRGISLEAEPFEDYWQGEVLKFPEVSVVWREEDTVRAAMVTTGEADWAYDVGPQNLNSVPNAIIGESSEVVVLKINSKNREPFQDPKVRLALRHAIDCETINEQLYDGLGICRGSPFNDKLTGSRPDIQVPHEYNPQLARQLLDEADYFNKWPDFEFDVMTRNGRFPRDVEMFEAIAGMWGEVGFKAGVALVEPSIWTNHYNQNDTNSPFFGVGADIISWPHGNETGDSWFSLRNILCSHRAGYGCDEFLDPQIIPSAALSGPGREQKLYELWKYVYDTGLFPGVLELPIVYGVSDRLEFISRAEREVRWDEQLRWLE